MDVSHRGKSIRTVHCRSASRLIQQESRELLVFLVKSANAEAALAAGGL
jgi:hypothetical protein